MEEKRVSIKDKDSLFSSEEEQEVEEDLEQNEDDLLKYPKPEYSAEDLDKLIQFIKNITTLYDLRESDWTSGNDNVIREFFLEPAEPILSVYFQLDDLICQLGVPSTYYTDLTYFIREPLEIFDVTTFHDRITFGTCNDSIEETMLKLMENVYAPIFFNATTWPDSVKSDYCSHIHIFLSKLTDIYYKTLGLTVIYIPREGLNLTVEEASLDKELIKRLEAVVVYWTRQIRIILQDQDQNNHGELLTPIDEFEFWHYRYENLSGVGYQLTNKNLKHTCDILLAVQSLYVKQFQAVADEIGQKMTEAKSNIEYLQIIVEPCKELQSITKPEQIPEKIPKILTLFRYIWLNSKYYNTPYALTMLCRSLTNQVIVSCTTFIDLNVAFKSKKTRAAIAMFETCIECCNRYIQIYTLVADSHTMFGEKPWNLDKAPIFNHLDSFIQRCHDMIEICDAMITFGRFDETERIPKPKFAGTRGLEFENWCEKIENMFIESLSHVINEKDLILDVGTSAWYEEILKFRSRMKDIEIVIENLVNSVFDQIPTVDEGVETLAAFYNYSKRPTLKPLFDRKTLFVYQLFRQEIQDCKADLVNEADEYPSYLPFFAGKAIMAEMKKVRLENLKKVLDDACWMSPCSISEEVFIQYEKLISSINDIILNLYRKFNEMIGDDLVKKLERSLMCRSTTRPGLLECNIDRSFIVFYYEIHYWLSLKYDIPTNCVQIYKRARNLRFIYENVKQVVRDYNKILASLSDEERLLFKQLINIVEKKIAPGLSKLTWIADVGDAYTAECSACTAELQDFLDDYKTCNLQIVSICEKVCDTPIINVPPNYAFELKELSKQMFDYRENTLDKLTYFYQEIIRYLIVVYEGFEQHIQSMADQWIKYIIKFDILLEEALRVSIRNSMQSMFEMLHGDGSTGPNPLLKLQANLKHNRINFEPSLSEVANVISNVLPSIRDGLEALPRVTEKFHIEDEMIRQFSQVILEDADCNKLQFLLNNEVRTNVGKIQEYMQAWEPFKDLWEVDKDRFIERYEKENPTAEQFDANIGRYTELANNVQLIEGITQVYFIVVNSSDLKKSIIDHCIEWQSKLSASLLNITKVMIDHVFEYIKINAADVMRVPTTLEDMSQAIDLYQTLMDEAPSEAKQFACITDQMVTMDKYHVEIEESMRKKEKDIPVEWAKYLVILEEADKMINYAKVVIAEMRQQGTIPKQIKPIKRRKY